MKIKLTQDEAAKVIAVLEALAKEEKPSFGDAVKKIIAKIKEASEETNTPFLNEEMKLLGWEDSCTAPLGVFVYVQGLGLCPNIAMRTSECWIDVHGQLADPKAWLNRTTEAA
jgi:hypothetical protein